MEMKADLSILQRREPAVGKDLVFGGRVEVLTLTGVVSSPPHCSTWDEIAQQSARLTVPHE